MRVAFTSDLHVDVTGRNGAILPYIVDRVVALDPDALVIAGDAANSLYRLDAALSAFDAVGCRRFFVPGNHDLWAESHRAVRKGKDSSFKHDEAVPAVCKKRGFEFLPGAPTILDGLGLVGSLGWYDFSFRSCVFDDVYSLADYERGELNDARYRTGVWNDCRDIVWLADRNADDWKRRSVRLDPVAVFEEIFRRFVSDLRETQPRAERLLVVLHTNPFLECLRHRDPPDPFDAYEGAIRLGDELVRVAASTPTVCFCGHRHTALDTVVRGVRVVRSPVGYLDSFCGDLSEHAGKCVRLLEL